MLKSCQAAGEALTVDMRRVGTVLLFPPMLQIYAPDGSSERNGIYESSVLCICL